MTESLPGGRTGGWAARDFHDEVGRRRVLLERGATAAVVTTLAFVVFLLAIQHENTSCGEACYDGGLRTYQPGHPWTSYDGAWQWQAQWFVALAALVLGVAAVVVTGRGAQRRFTPWLMAGSVALCAVWVLWRVLEPAIPS